MEQMKMTMPIIRARARFERVIYGGQTPKYRLTQYAGSIAFLGVLKEAFTGKDGYISVYLNAELESVAQKKESVEAFLQTVRGSYRLTGLHQYYTDGKPSGYAYGNPLQEKTYSAKKKPNPLFLFREDAYLFKFKYEKDQSDLLPASFEWVILQGKEVSKLTSMYLSSYRLSGFNEALKELPLMKVDAL